MEVLEYKFSYCSVNEVESKMPVIVVSGGNATRMKGIDKQMLEICGVPVVIRTLMAFEKCDSISDIILVAKKSEVLNLQGLCNKYKITKLSDIVEGGKTRHESVMCGFSRLSEKNTCVLIHDGARPFVSEKTIKNVCKALKTCDASLAAQKIVDTVKNTDGELTVVNTLDRTNLYLAQTPQGVNIKKYLSACEKADADKFTDDASIMENAGYKVAVCESERTNIKITTPEDIAFAEAICKIREREGN